MNSSFSSHNQNNESFESENSFETTNMSFVGSDADYEARQAAAKTEPQWRGIGFKEELLVWQIDGPHVKEWPRYKYGQFYGNDCYLVLRSSKPRWKKRMQPNQITDMSTEDKLKHDLHLWVGSKSSGVVQGIAAYKLVEANTFLGRNATQHREEEGQESKLFLSYFGNRIQIIETQLLQHVKQVLNKSKPKKGKKSPKGVHRLMRMLESHDINTMDIPDIENSNHANMFHSRTKANIKAIKNSNDTNKFHSKLKTNIEPVQNINHTDKFDSKTKTNIKSKENKKNPMTLGYKQNGNSSRQNLFKQNQTGKEVAQLSPKTPLQYPFFSISTRPLESHSTTLQSNDRGPSLVKNRLMKNKTYTTSSHRVLRLTQKAQKKVQIQARTPVQDSKHGHPPSSTKKNEPVLFLLKSSDGAQLEKVTITNSSMSGMKIDKSVLNSNEGYLFDSGSQIYVWLGRFLTIYAKKSAPSQVANYLQSSKRLGVPIIFIQEGQSNANFDSFFHEPNHSKKEIETSPWCVKNPGNKVLKYVQACKNPVRS